MSRLGHERTSVSALMGVQVVDATGASLGRVAELAVSPTIDSARVEALVLQSGLPLGLLGRAPRRSLLRIAQIATIPNGAINLPANAAVEALPADDTYLLLERDLLDQQIIDIHGHKVVRVNDVDLVWEPQPEGALSLRIAEVEVGSRGALRRLLKGLPAAFVGALTDRFRPSVIPWEFVDLIDRDPARRVRLKIEQERLSRMHPSDLADILEELAPSERESLFSSLDEEVAAEALEEVEPRTQRTLIESLDSARVAGILEEMDPGAAADLLAELSDERSDAILHEMDPEERQVVEDLLEYEPDSAAGLMTSEFLALPPQSTVSEARQALQSFEGDSDCITDLFLTDEAGVLLGRVPLIALLLAEPSTALHQLTAEHLVQTTKTTTGRKVADLFDKYNLHSLPVVDTNSILQGVIRTDQVISMLHAERR